MAINTTKTKNDKTVMNPGLQSVIERVQSANNILVTVSSNPSVDELAAAIGTTLYLNKMGKHATAVFSGNAPSTIEFLKPEKTLESNTDSLRDFIISLDKAKADKLRYKVEDKIVKIFITPYRTSLSGDDLDFSHGDFNVEVVLAIGIKAQLEVDKAITAHGRILHDATVVSINNKPGASIGSIHWEDTQASSLCEMMTSMGVALQSDVIDSQIATALLTGIVAETDRFRNAKTNSNTMTISGQLMAAGANQQLVAEKLEETHEIQDADAVEGQTKSKKSNKRDDEAGDNKTNDDGVLDISHNNQHDSDDEQDEDSSAADDSNDDLADLEVDLGDSDDAKRHIHIDEHGNMQGLDHADQEPSDKKSSNDENSDKDDKPPTNGRSRLVVEPPSLGGALSAADATANPDVQSPMNLPPVDRPTLSRDDPVRPKSIDFDADAASKELDKPDNPQDSSDTPAASDSTPRDIGAARDAVQDALDNPGSDQPLEPIEALNAQPVDLDLGHNEPPTSPGNPVEPPAQSPIQQPGGQADLPTVPDVLPAPENQAPDPQLAAAPEVVAPSTDTPAVNDQPPNPLRPLPPPTQDAAQSDQPPKLKNSMVMPPQWTPPPSSAATQPFSPTGPQTPGPSGAPAGEPTPPVPTGTGRPGPGAPPPVPPPMMPPM